MPEDRVLSDRLKRHVVWVCAGCDQCEPLDGAPPSRFPCRDSPSLNGAEVVLAEEHKAEVDRLRADFQKVGAAFMALYLQGLNGVVCDPDAEPGRHGCGACLDAWKQGREVVDRYDPKAGSMYRRGPIFQPSADSLALDDNDAKEN